MTQRQPHEAAVGALKMIPTKWAIIIVVALIGYVLLQPRLNQWFGWHLPSFASMVGDEKPAPKHVDKTKTKETGKEKESPTQTKAKEAEEDTQSNSATETSTTKKSTGKKQNSKPKSTTKSDEPAEELIQTADAQVATKTETKKGTVAKKADDDSDLMHGVLTEVGRNRYESPEGLIYGPGSEEGHRLKHIARHLEDQPDRPGSHGVFKGEMKDFLLAIDDGYARAKRGAKGTKKTEEDDSVVYEASFDKAIGFQGGREGDRKGNPALKRLRIVVRGNFVITAFPF